MVVVAHAGVRLKRASRRSTRSSARCAASARSTRTCWSGGSTCRCAPCRPSCVLCKPHVRLVLRTHQLHRGACVAGRQRQRVELAAVSGARARRCQCRLRASETRGASTASVTHTPYVLPAASMTIHGFLACTSEMQLRRRLDAVNAARAEIPTIESVIGERKLQHAALVAEAAEFEATATATKKETEVLMQVSAPVTARMRPGARVHAARASSACILTCIACRRSSRPKASRRSRRRRCWRSSNRARH